MNNFFIKTVKTQLKNFLPNRYQDADIEIDLVKKSNGRNLTGLFIRKDLSKGLPTIYLNDFEKEYLKGKDIELILKEIAKLVLDAEDNNYTDIEDIVNNIIDYNFVKNLLAIRMVDYENSREFLIDKPYKKFGNLAITYRIQFDFGNDLIYSTTITNDLLNSWKVSKEELHEDALKSEKEKRPVWLIGMDFNNLFTPISLDQSNNLFNSSAPLDKKANMYVLTNKQKTNGAAAIAQKNILEKIGELFNKNFYILPSSIHEFMLVPDNNNSKLQEYNSMVTDINSSILLEDDLLSNKAMYYDRNKKELIY